MAQGDFEGRRPAGAAGWWSWRPCSYALHYPVDDRCADHPFAAALPERFDLLDRGDSRGHSGASRSRPRISSAAHRALAARHGGGDGAGLTHYLTFPRFGPGPRRAALLTMIERGEVTALEVEGRPGRWLASRATSPPSRGRAGRPRPREGRPSFRLRFAPVVSRRVAPLRLRLTASRSTRPATSGCTAYYTLPILHHGHLIGRVDAKSHRAEGR